MMHIEPFIARWKDREGGQERANYALFLSELCDVLSVARPDPANADKNYGQRRYTMARSIGEVRKALDPMVPEAAQ